VSFTTRRRSFKTSCWSSGSVRSATSRPTTTVGTAPRHPRAVERGTPRSAATVTSLVRWTRFPKPVVVALLGAGPGRHRNDHRPFQHAAQLLEGDRSVRRRDDNSRRKVRNVREDSPMSVSGLTMTTDGSPSGPSAREKSPEPTVYRRESQRPPTSPLQDLQLMPRRQNFELSAARDRAHVRRVRRRDRRTDIVVRKRPHRRPQHQLFQLVRLCQIRN
jgi:hypothetical protein